LSSVGWDLRIGRVQHKFTNLYHPVSVDITIDVVVQNLYFLFHFVFLSVGRLFVVK